MHAPVVKTPTQTAATCCCIPMVLEGILDICLVICAWVLLSVCVIIYLQILYYNTPRTAYGTGTRDGFDDFCITTYTLIENHTLEVHLV